MSERKAIVPESIFLDETLSKSAIRVYGVLCAYADKNDGTCYPSRSTLGEKLKIAPKKVFNYLQELIDKGYITKAYRHRENGTCTSNLYTIVGYLNLLNHKHEEQQMDKIDYPQNGDSIPKEGMVTIPKMGIPAIPDLGIVTIPKMGIGITTQENYPLNNPVEQTNIAVPALVPTNTTPKLNGKKKKEPAQGLADLAIPDWLPRDVWVMWVDYRIGTKKPMTLDAANLTISGLSVARDSGWDPIELIHDAIMKGWQGCVYSQHRKPKPAENTLTNQRGGHNGKPFYRNNQRVEPTPVEALLREKEEFTRRFESQHGANRNAT
jgi:hypothetical protein